MSLHLPAMMKTLCVSLQQMWLLTIFLWINQAEYRPQAAERQTLKVVGNSASRGWGNAGSNGGNAEFTANDQSLSGDIVVDTISALNFKLDGNSSFTGTLNIIPNEQNGTAVNDNITVEISESSIWTLTGDCTITSLENNGKINFNGHTITLADGTVLKE